MSFGGPFTTEQVEDVKTFLRIVCILIPVDCEIKLYNEGKIGDFVIRINSSGQLIMSLWLVYPCTRICV